MEAGRLLKYLLGVVKDFAPKSPIYFQILEMAKAFRRALTTIRRKMGHKV
jgi:hypothetical protein